MLKDKDATGVGRALADSVDHWYAATLSPPRGRTGCDLVKVLREVGVAGTMSPFASVTAACRAAVRKAGIGDRILVFGSFYTVSEVLNAGLPVVGDLPATEPGGGDLG